MEKAETTNIRLNKLRQELSEAKMQALLVTDLLNIRYLSGFTGSNAFLVVTTDDVLLLTDSRYTEQASEECPGIAVRLIDSRWVAAVGEIAADLALDSLGFEAHALTYSDWENLSGALKKVTLVSTRNMVETLRAVKDSFEIAAIREAIRITDAACAHAFEVVKPGMTEREIALEIDCAMRRLGADKEGFDTIVASGPRAALPHGKPTGRVVSAGELVVMDFGALCNGYNGDITRTVSLVNADDRQKEVYDIVLQAQRKAIKAIKPGVRGGDVDAIAREHIAGHGLDQYFGHGLGHDLGLAVHDGRALARNSDILLREGMVITVEPGIYIPGWSGIRIEDDVLVTKSGYEVLTISPRDLVLT